MNTTTPQPAAVPDNTRGLGRIGIWSMEMRFGDPAQTAAAAAAVEAMGYGAIWLPGGIGGDILGDIDHQLDATKTIKFATGILNIYRQEAPYTVAWWNAKSPAVRDRVMLGIGVSHGPVIGEAYRKPLGAMSDYLDLLDQAGVSAEHRCLAALGPKMLELARDRSAGAHPYLVTAEHTAEARAILGPRALLAPELGVVVETDPAKARAIARAALVLYQGLPNYVNNWRRLGFSEAETTDASDRLVDSLFAWGSAEQIAARVEAHFAAGADHVCLQVLHEGAATLSPPLEEWRALAAALKL